MLYLWWAVKKMYVLYCSICSEENKILYPIKLYDFYFFFIQFVLHAPRAVQWNNYTECGTHMPASCRTQTSMLCMRAFKEKVSWLRKHIIFKRARMYQDNAKVGRTAETKKKIFSEYPPGYILYVCILRRFSYIYLCVLIIIISS